MLAWSLSIPGHSHLSAAEHLQEVCTGCCADRVGNKQAQGAPPVHFGASPAAGA